jgi:hypothetical protein
MSAQTTIDRLPGGLTLVRHYDPGAGSVDAQCGSLAEWQGYAAQLGQDSLEYYARPDGTHKFWEKVEINTYSRFLPFPNAQLALALTYSLGGGKSRIDIQYFDPAANPYRFPAALSHEMGHAFHNWCGLYGADNAGLGDVAAMWERLVSTNASAYDASKEPWSRDPGWEQFANAYRFLFGTSQAPGATRGSSGPGTPDGVVQGFEDPKGHPDWRKMFQWLPELCAFIRTYGCAPGSLQWYGNWCFFFQTAREANGLPAGTWVFQDYYYTIAGRTDGWHKRVGASWQQFAPTYSRT